MAKWNTISLKEVIKEISSGRIVLPVIQRELVWETEKMKIYKSLPARPNN